MKDGRNISPWLWVPTLYFAEGIPYFVVNSISVIMFKKLGMGNADIAVYTGLLYLPWVIKPLWSPFVDIIRTKRWWIITAQTIVTVTLAIAALSVPHGLGAPTFTLTLIIFWITAFASATHDIAADGFYMLALDGGRQSLFVGIRNLFYRLSSVFGQGVLVVIAGLLETRTGNIPLAWTLTLLIGALIFAAITVYHLFFLPKPPSDGGKLNGNPSSVVEKGVKDECCSIEEGSSEVDESIYKNDGVKEDGCEVGECITKSNSIGNESAGMKESSVCENIEKEGSEAVGLKEQSKEIFREFGRTFATFFRKKGVVLAMIFMLLYRLPEALLLKMLNPFLLDPVSAGGLGLSTETVGVVYGTVGVLALTLGGILGGIAASRWGLKKSMLPMALCIALPCAVFVFLSFVQPSNLLVINACVALDQFGYGFGFTAYMLYLMYFADGEFKTSHYSLCTAFMALSMMLPGMVAGWLEEWLGYRGFFILVVVCCLVTVGVTLCMKVDPDYGKYNKTNENQ
ncbi:MAG: MFS transporter [Bacteroidales bacterium]|nr:MFS transporter [Bacteroidales bacterium]